MKEKNLVILCLVFAVLVALVYVKNNIQTSSIEEEEDLTDIIAPVITKDTITDLIISLPATAADENQDKVHKVHLAREKDSWIVKTHYGVQGYDRAIDPVIERLDHIQGEFRSDNVEVLSDYGIGDDSAIRLELLGEEFNPIKMLVGTQKTERQNSFVRFDKSSQVYLVSADLPALLGVFEKDGAFLLDLNKWTDKKILHLDTGKVTGLEIIQRNDLGEDRQVIKIKKETVDGKTQWKSEGPLAFNLSGDKIKSVIEVFNNTYARDIVAPESEDAFESPAWKAVFTFEGGENVVLSRGKKDDQGNFYFYREGAGFYYLIPVSTFYSRVNQQSNIFAANPLGTDEESMSELEIYGVEGKKKFLALKKTVAAEETGSSISEGDNQKTADVVQWQNSKGDKIEQSKMTDIINKLKAVNVEWVLPPEFSFEKAITLRIVRQEGEKKYSISELIKINDTKECHFLQIEGEESDGYCLSKPQVSAIVNSLP